MCNAPPFRRVKVAEVVDGPYRVFEAPGNAGVGDAAVLDDVFEDGAGDAAELGGEDASFLHLFFIFLPGGRIGLGFLRLGEVEVGCCCGGGGVLVTMGR